MEGTVELGINNNESMNEFLERLMTEKTTSGKEVAGNVKGFQFSTYDCDTVEQLRNKVAQELESYIKSNKQAVNSNTSKRLTDLYSMIFEKDIDEDLVADNLEYIDFDDPSDIAQWIDASTEFLNSPEFARLTFKNGKTAAEIMVGLLEEKGYGHPSPTDDPITQQINEKMSDLKEYGYLVHDFFENQPIEVRENNQPIINPEPIKEEEPVVNSNNFQQVPKEDEFSRNTYFRKMPKYNDKSMIQEMAKANEESAFQSMSNQEGQPQTAENPLDNIEAIRQGFNIPSQDIAENKSAVAFATMTGDAHDIEVAKIALQAIPDNDPEKANLASKLQEIINMQSPVDNKVDHDKEIQAIQDKLVETQKQIFRLRNRQGEVVEQMREIRELKNELENKPAFVSTTLGFPMNPENQKKAEAAIQKVLQMASPLSVGLDSKTRNNDAMPYFRKAAENHTKGEIFQALNATEQLGPSHTFTRDLTIALDEISKTYYNKTADEIRQQIKECSKAINEVHNVVFQNASLNNPEMDGHKAIEAFDQAVMDHTKENIVAALKATELLENGHEYKAVLEDALDKMAATHLDITLEDLRKEQKSILAAEKAVKEVESLTSFAATGIPYDIKNNAAMPYYNKAMETRSKEDILLALVAVEELGQNHMLARPLKDALDKTAIAYYGIDASGIREQIRNCSKAINEVNELEKTVSEENKSNDAIPYYKKAMETKSAEYIKIALDEVNKLADDHPMKQALLNALNAELAVINNNPQEVKRELDQETKEKATKLIEDNKEINDKIKELEDEQKKLVAEQQKLMEEQEKERLAQENNNPPADNPESDNPENEEENEEDLSQGDNGSDNPEEEPTEEDEEEIEEDPPRRVVSDEINQNIGLFKKAILGIDKVIEKFKSTKVGKVVIPVALATAVLAGPVGIPVWGGYLFVRKKAKKYRKKLEEQQNLDDEEYEDEYDEEEVEEQENSHEQENNPQEDQEEKQDEYADLTNKIIQESMKAVIPRVQYYTSEEDNWKAINNENPEEVQEILDALANGENIGYKIVEGNNEQTPEVQLINPELLENYLQEHQATLPTVDEIASVSAENQMSPLQNQEEMGRGM